MRMNTPSVHIGQDERMSAEFTNNPDWDFDCTTVTQTKPQYSGPDMIYLLDFYCKDEWRPFAKRFADLVNQFQAELDAAAQITQAEAKEAEGAMATEEAEQVA